MAPWKIAVLIFSAVASAAQAEAPRGDRDHCILDAPPVLHPKAPGLFIDRIASESSEVVYQGRLGGASFNVVENRCESKFEQISIVATDAAGFSLQDAMARISRAFDLDPAFRDRRLLTTLQAKGVLDADKGVVSITARYDQIGRAIIVSIAVDKQM